MNEEQAKEVVTLIRAATGGRADESTIHYFEAALSGLDYELALSAASVGTITWRWFPSWAEFKEVYRAHKRLAEPVGEQRSVPERDYPSDGSGSSEPVDVGKRGDHAPEWVHVWSWCRLARAPRNFRGFPQQDGWTDPKNIMPMSDYEELHAEWVAAGSPKSDNPLPMARG